MTTTRLKLGREILIKLSLGKLVVLSQKQNMIFYLVLDKISKQRGKNNSL